MNQGPDRNDQPDAAPSPEGTAQPANATADVGQKRSAEPLTEPVKLPPPPVPPPQAATSRSRWPVPLLMLSMLVILGVAAGGGWLLHERIDALSAHQVVLQQRQGTLDGGLSTLQKEVAEFRTRLGAMAGEIKSLASAPSPASPMPSSPPAAGSGADSALTAQLADLGRRLDRLEQQAGDLTQQAASLDRQLSELTVTPATTKMLMSRVEQLEGDSLQAKRLADRLRELEAGAAVTKNQVGGLTATVLALNQLGEALAGSGSFVQPLQALQALNREDTEMQSALKTIAPRAGSGIPSLELLRTRFPATAAAVKNAEFTVSGEGWWQRALSRITGLVTVRRTGPDAIAAGGTDAALATAEQALQTSDLAGAIRAMEVIEGKGAEAAAPWLEDARLRLAADSVLTELYGRAIARLNALKG